MGSLMCEILTWKILVFVNSMYCLDEDPETIVLLSSMLGGKILNLFKSSNHVFKILPLHQKLNDSFKKEEVLQCLL